MFTRARRNEAVLPPPIPLEVEGVRVELRRKHIKNMYIRVLPPEGRVCVTAPVRIPTRSIHQFVVSRLSWIERHQERIRKQQRDVAPAYVNGDACYVWGRPVRLRVEERPARQAVEMTEDELLLVVRPGTSMEKRRAKVEAWLRQQLRDAVPLLVAKWEPVMGVKMRQLYVQRMKTRWGSCNTRAHTIRLNTELASRPPACLEYVLVHELVHLLEASHNARFYRLMDHYLPDWKSREALLRERALLPDVQQDEIC